MEEIKYFIYNSKSNIVQDLESYTLTGAQDMLEQLMHFSKDDGWNYIPVDKIPTGAVLQSEQE